MAGALLLAGNAGCNLFRSPNAGSGTHLDKPQERPQSKNSQNSRVIVVEVTTDATGSVTAVQFKRSSGSDAVDNYVANSIHQNWPRQASMVTVAELTYSIADGFSQPKTISSHPAPAS